MTVTIVKGVTADDSVGAASITGTVAVANGGTGATTLTGILLGNGTSAVTALTTSAGIAGAISDETGSGALVFANTPTLISPLLGTPTSGVMTNVTGTAAGLTAGNATLAATATVSTNLFNTVAATVTDSTGRITYPAQPLVLAELATPLTNKTGDGSQAAVIYDTVQTNRGSVYNTTTGVFTAPVTGNYLFTIGVHLTSLGAAHTSANYFVPAPGRADHNVIINNPFNGAYILNGSYLSTASTIVFMTATNTTSVTGQVSGGTKTVGYGGAGSLQIWLLG